MFSVGTGRYTPSRHTHAHKNTTNPHLRSLSFDSLAFCQAPEMGLWLRYLPRFSNRDTGTERNSDTKNNHSALHTIPLQQPFVSPQKHTPVWNKAIYVSTYFRESAQGQILHLYSGWQQRCAGAAFLSRRCCLHSNSHTSQASKTAVWKLIVGIQTIQRRIFPTGSSQTSALTKSDNSSRVRSLC